MCVFGGLDRHKVPRFGKDGHVRQGWGAMFSSHTGGFMELRAEYGQMGRPPRFGVVRRSGEGSVFFQEGSQPIQ